MRIGWLVAGLLSAALLTGCMQVRVTEGQFIRPDAPGRVPDRRAAAADVVDLQVAASDGAVLNGILYEQPGARSTLLYFGGNMFHLDQHLDAVLPLLAKCGTNVALFDYRGYGRTPGQPTVENMGSDALALFDALNARHPGRVIVHGQSLGGFMAANVAQARPVLATVLETTATNATGLVESQLPWYARPFVRIEMDAPLRQADNLTAAARFTAPALVIAAGRDRTTPPRMGKALFDAVPRSDKRWLLLDDADHNGALRASASGPAYCDFVRAAEGG